MSKKTNNMNDDKMPKDSLENKVESTVEAVESKVENTVESIKTNMMDSNNSEWNWKMISYVLIGIIVLMALSAGGYYFYKHRGGANNTSNVSQYNDDTASNALLNLGKDATAKNYKEALGRIALDDVVAGIADSDIMWKSELVRQGQTDPKPEDIQKFKDYIKGTPAVYAQLTTSIKMSFLDAIQGDEDANVDLVKLFGDLETGKLPESFKDENSEATFDIPNRKEVWHMKKYDTGYKVYKIDITE